MSKNFPKKVGIIFLENLSEKKMKLNFDQFACSYLLVQMNFVQKIFDFNIVEVDFKFKDSLLDQELIKRKNDYIFDWFDDLLAKKSEKSLKEIDQNIDYWIGITSKSVHKNWFFETKFKNTTRSNKTFGIITTDTWEKSYSPPSVFEYIVITIFEICLGALSYDYGGSFFTHEQWITKGCLNDFTNLKPHRRTIISNPNLCEECKYKLDDLDKTIRNFYKEISLKKDVQNILSKTWMGDPNLRESPLFNLKKNFKYDIDRNSGFYKNTKEKVRDTIIENLPQWVIGSLLTSVITGIVTGVIAASVLLLGLK